MTNVACRIAILVTLCCALASYVDAKVRPRPIFGGDPYKGRNIARDVLLPGELIADVLSFGAVPNGKTDSTQAFMDAWQKVCHSKIRTRLLVPLGKFLVSSMFFGGEGCEGPAPFTIQVEGTILATTDLSEYVNSDWLIFEGIAGLKLIGRGTFDGQGSEKVWKYITCNPNANQQCQRAPASIKLNNVSDALVQNIKSVNPKGFHFFVTNSVNIRLRRLKIIAPANSPNTDGIHISHSIKVQIARCTIQTGDDCISMIQGVNNITVTRLTCGPGHGISVGSLGKYPDELEVRDVLVQNSMLQGTTNGVRIKTWPEKYPGLARDITFAGITMTNVKNPIIVDQEYECFPNCKKKGSLVRVSDVTFTNIRGTTISRVAVDLRCSGTYPCQNVRLTNIDLRNGSFPTTSRCQNIKPIYNGFHMPERCV